MPYIITEKIQPVKKVALVLNDNIVYYAYIVIEEAFIQKAKKDLSAKLEFLSHRIGEMESESEEGLETQIEDIDRASMESSSLEKESQLTILKKEKEAVELTLSKIEKSRFGLCEKCGQTIDQARLMILPTARLCMNCKIICDSCGEEIEEAEILGKKVPLICKGCREEIEPETYYTSRSIKPE